MADKPMNILAYEPPQRSPDQWQLARITGVLAAAALVAAMFLALITFVLREKQSRYSPQYIQYLQRMATAPAGATIPAFTGPVRAPRRSILAFGTTWAAIGSVGASVALFVLHRRLDRRRFPPGAAPGAFPSRADGPIMPLR